MKILLVHGIWDDGAIFRRMIRALEDEGHACLAPSLKPANGAEGLEPLAEQLAGIVESDLAESEPFALVGFSMGAVISRIFLQELGGAERVTHFFSISGPHRGTLTALFWPGKAARDMRPGSKLLKRLNRAALANEKTEVHCYRTPLDLLVIPSGSSKLPEAATETIVPALMHHRMLVHPEIPTHINAVLKKGRG